MIQLATKYRRREKRRTPVTNESNGDVIKAVRWAFSLFRRQFDQVANIEMNRIRSVVGASTILIDSNTRFANTCRSVRRAARLVSFRKTPQNEPLRNCPQSKQRRPVVRRKRMKFVMTCALGIFNATGNYQSTLTAIDNA